MLPLVIYVLLSPPVLGGLPSPLRHGQNGILDEELLFGAPIVVTLLILLISSRRARGSQERIRIRTTRGITSDAVDMPDTDAFVEGKQVDDMPR